MLDDLAKEESSPDSRVLKKQQVETPEDESAWNVYTGKLISQPNYILPNVRKIIKITICTIDNSPVSNQVNDTNHQQQNEVIVTSNALSDTPIKPALIALSRFGDAVLSRISSISSNNGNAFGSSNNPGDDISVNISYNIDMNSSSVESNLDSPLRSRNDTTTARANQISSMIIPPITKRFSGSSFLDEKDNTMLETPTPTPHTTTALLYSDNGKSSPSASEKQILLADCDSTAAEAIINADKKLGKATTTAEILFRYPSTIEPPPQEVSDVSIYIPLMNIQDNNYIINI